MRHAGPAGPGRSTVRGRQDRGGLPRERRLVRSRRPPGPERPRPPLSCRRAPTGPADVLRAIGTPVALLGLLVGFLLAVVAQAYTQAATARALGDRAAFRRLGGIRRVLDPFGAVAAALAGPGWGVTPEIPLRSRGRLALALLSGPLAVAALGVLALLGFVLAGGPRQALPGTGPSSVVGGVDGPAGQVFFLALGLELLGMAVLALVPLPPLPGWRLLELASTGSPGWQRAREYLVEKNLGVLALLILLVLPLGGSDPLLIAIIDTAVGSLVDVAA